MPLSRSRRSIAAAAVAWLCLLIAGPMAVLGHAELDTVTPQDKSTAAAPSEIVMTFTEGLDASGSNIRLVDSAGAVVAQGGSVDPANAKEMTLAVPALAPGGYTIRWTSKSAQDGDIARGTTTFTATTAASASPAASQASAEATVEPSTASSGPTDSPSPSGGSATSTSSTDALLPIVVAIVVVGALGTWLLQRRSRQAR